VEGRVVCEVAIKEKVVVEVLRWVCVEVLRGANGVPLKVTNLSLVLVQREVAST